MKWWALQKPHNEWRSFVLTVQSGYLKEGRYFALTPKGAGVV